MSEREELLQRIDAFSEKSDVRMFTEDDVLLFPETMVYDGRLLEGSALPLEFGGVHDQKTHGRKKGGTAHDKFRDSFGEYDAATGIPSAESAGNAAEQTSLMMGGVGPREQEAVDGYLEDQAIDYLDGPLVHGTTVEAAVEMSTEGLQSRGTMRRETQAEIDAMPDSAQKDMLNENLKKRGTSYPADAEAGMDEFVFMTHGEGAGYGDVDVIIDNEVLTQGGTFATGVDVLATSGGTMETFKGDPGQLKGGTFKEDVIPNDIKSNYRKQQVNGSKVEGFNEQGYSSDYESVAAHNYATKRARNESLEFGANEGEFSMEVKATHVPAKSIKAYAVSDEGTANALIDNGIDPGKIIVWNHRSSAVIDHSADDSKGWIEVGVADQFGGITHLEASNPAKIAALRSIQKKGNVNPGAIDSEILNAS